MLLVPRCIIKIKNEETYTTFKKMIQVITCYSFFEHVSEEIINGELELWYAKWSKQETEGTLLLVFVLFIKLILYKYYVYFFREKYL